MHLEPKLQKSLDEAVTKFQQLITPRDVADLLEIPVGQLLHILYRQPQSKNFISFLLPKKTSGFRTIKAPKGSRKILLEKIKPILYQLYKAKACVHGFARNRSIVSNARGHRKNKYILNIDLVDFFNTIHFGRIRGLFMSHPFSMGEKAATVMAQICTLEGHLFQGSPVSPVLSNFIARDLDNKLINIAKKYKLTYTRYADDITFSTTQDSFPRSLASYVGNNPVTQDVVIGNLLVETINSAGFQINYDKIRLQIKSVRQDVTGLTVNEFPNVKRTYIRNLRGMLHAWEKYGLLAAETTLIEKFARNPPHINPDKRNGTYFKNVLYGKIAFVKMVRGETDNIYLKLCLKAASLDSEPPKFIKKMTIMHQKYDVFLSHASEDKEHIVRPIHNELVKLGVLSFLDEEYIKWGDSLTEKINHALGKSKFVLAVLSENFVGEKKVWTNKEINTALHREISGKQKILPLLVGKPDLSNLSLLEDKFYLEWKGNPEEIAKKIHELLQ